MKRETEPASDSSLEGNTSSLYTLLKKPEDKSRTGRGESVEGLKIPGITTSDHIYYNVSWRNVPLVVSGGFSDYDGTKANDRFR